jgi:DNA modification methylase
MNKIIQGDCLEVLKTLPSESINCVVTSPPYYGLRCYLPDEVKIKDSLSEEKKKEIENELTLLGIKSIIRV